MTSTDSRQADQWEISMRKDKRGEQQNTKSCENLNTSHSNTKSAHEKEKVGNKKNVTLQPNE